MSDKRKYINQLDPPVSNLPNSIETSWEQNQGGIPFKVQKEHVCLQYAKRHCSDKLHIKFTVPRNIRRYPKYSKTAFILTRSNETPDVEKQSQFCFRKSPIVRKTQKGDTFGLQRAFPSRIFSEVKGF